MLVNASPGVHVAVPRAPGPRHGLDSLTLIVLLLPDLTPMRIRLLLAVALLVPGLTTAQTPSRPRTRAAAIPSPASFLGFEPGADRRLPSWQEITEYFVALDKASPRVSVRTLGKTTMGRPFIVAFIADSSTLANLDRFRQIQRKLMDPRQRVAGERANLIAQGRNVILITSAIHSTEVGGFTTPIVLADRLARAETPEARSILANTIIMLVPSQNPDGVDIVGDHYRATLGTPREGSEGPELYHKYVGHDNNRDWYAFTQVETRYTVDSLYSPWYPQIVNDVHQQGSAVSRIFIPPYMDPVEPNIDPILTAATNGLGMSMVWRMTADGFTGIASNASYDQWSPARQFSLYHRGARLLTETASARLASPVEMPFERLGSSRGYNAKEATWNFPSPWPGGTWRYGDIVRYQTAASWALLVQAAENRTAWLEAYAHMGDRALGPLPAWGRDAWPSAYIIPRVQPDSIATQRLLWTLQHGGVEVHETNAPVTVDAVTHPARSWIVPLQQPFGGYAKTLLERQKYPNLFDYPGGPPKRPYDVTAHTLPLLFGVNVAAVSGAAPSFGAKIAAIPEPTYTAPIANGVRSVALYKLSTRGNMDEGWTRWVLEKFGVPYAQITEVDIASGSLASRFDVLILPDQSGGQLSSALGAGGIAAVDAFVRGGGSLLTFNNASNFAIDALKLPVRNVLTGVPSSEFYAPGSIIGVQKNRTSPLAGSFNPPVAGVWFENSPAFEITDPSAATAVLSYRDTGDPLLSGWLLGGSKLNGKSAMVDVQHGQGRVILYGFRPQYRGQPNATFNLIWSAIAR